MVTAVSWTVVPGGYEDWHFWFMGRPVAGGPAVWQRWPPGSTCGRTMFSSAVSVGSRLKSWKMKPVRQRSLVSVVSSSWVLVVPSIQASPIVGRSSPRANARRLARAARAHRCRQTSADVG
jgi:hypothetical protein